MFRHFYLTFYLKLPLKGIRYERIRKAMTGKIESKARSVYGADVVNTMHNHKCHKNSDKKISKI